MEVILHETVPNLGEPGDIVTVKDGYARNYLLPRKLAVIANRSNKLELEHQKKVAEAKKAGMRAKAEELASKLSEISVTISKDVGEEEKIFGSVTPMDISNALRAEGYIIDKRHIKIAEPIKKIGVYNVSVRLHSEVEGTLKVWVVKK